MLHSTVILAALCAYYLPPSVRLVSTVYLYGLSGRDERFFSSKSKIAIATMCAIQAEALM